MAKIIGRKAHLIVEDSMGVPRVVSPYLNSIVLKIKGDVVEVTSFGSATREWLPTFKNWELNFSGFYSSSEIDDVFAGILGSSTFIQFSPNGSASGNVRYSASGILTSYDMNASVDGAIMVSGTIIPHLGSLTRDTWSDPVPSWYIVPGHTCIAAYQAKGATSYTTSLINLANAGIYDAVEGIAPSWASGTGWTFNLSEYLQTGIVPAADQTWTLIVRVANIEQTGAYRTALGSRSTDNIYDIRIIPLANYYSRFDYGSNTNIDFVGSGILTLAGRNGYVDGINVCTLDVSTSVSTPRALFVGAFNAGIAAEKLKGDILAIAIYNSILNATEVADLRMRVVVL